MDENTNNRMAQFPNKRGRPNKTLQTERDKVPAIGEDQVVEAVPVEIEKRIACTRCGCLIVPRIIRTVGDVRQIRCNRCGYTHAIYPSVAEKLGWT